MLIEIQNKRNYIAQDDGSKTNTEPRGQYSSIHKKKKILNFNKLTTHLYIKGNLWKPPCIRPEGKCDFHLTNAIIMTSVLYTHLIIICDH